MNKGLAAIKGLAWINRKEKEGKIVQSCLDAKDITLSVDEICQEACVSRGTFFNYYHDMLNYKIIVLNHFVLNLYRENPNLQLEDYVKALLKHPQLHFCSVVLECIELKKSVCALDSDEIMFYYDTFDPEPYTNCLNRIFSRSFIILMLENI